jgi:hypothetical protein
MGGYTGGRSCDGVGVVCAFSLAFGVVFRCAVTVSGAACWGEESYTGSCEYNDGVTDVKARRTGWLLMCGRFPLYAAGGDQHRFDYAVFLLNKDIEQVGAPFCRGGC